MADFKNTFNFTLISMFFVIRPRRPYGVSGVILIELLRRSGSVYLSVRW